MQELPELEAIADRIIELRGQRVMLDADLAALYGVPTTRLNQQVRRNLARFPHRLRVPARCSRVDELEPVAEGDGFTPPNRATRVDQVAKCNQIATQQTTV